MQATNTGIRAALTGPWISIQPIPAAPKRNSSTSLISGHACSQVTSLVGGGEGVRGGTHALAFFPCGVGNLPAVM